MLDLSKDVMLSAFAQVVSMAGTRVALEQLGRKELQGFPFVPRPCFPLRMIMEEVNKQALGFCDDAWVKIVHALFAMHDMTNSPLVKRREISNEAAESKSSLQQSDVVSRNTDAPTVLP